MNQVEALEDRDAIDLVGPIVIDTHTDRITHLDIPQRLEHTMGLDGRDMLQSLFQQTRADRSYQHQQVDCHTPRIESLLASRWALPNRSSQTYSRLDGPAYQFASDIDDSLKTVAPAYSDETTFSLLILPPVGVQELADRGVQSAQWVSFRSASQDCRYYLSSSLIASLNIR
jgi:hypothetical protein